MAWFTAQFYNCPYYVLCHLHKKCTDSQKNVLLCQTTEVLNRKSLICRENFSEHFRVFSVLFVPSYLIRYVLLNQFLNI